MSVNFGAKVWTTGQIAKICNVAPRTVAKWFDAGKLRGYRIPLSQDRRIPRTNLIAFLKEHGMPLGNLETAEQFHTVTVGLEGLLRDRLTDSLPESERFFWRHFEAGLELGLHIADAPLDALVIDLAGNRGEGLHVLRRLRAMPEYARLEIIGLTSEDGMADLSSDGFSVIYQRPFDAALLAAWLRTLARVKWGLDVKCSANGHANGKTRV